MTTTVIACDRCYKDFPASLSFTQPLPNRYMMITKFLLEYDLSFFIIVQCLDITLFAVHDIYSPQPHLCSVIVLKCTVTVNYKTKYLFSSSIF